MGEGGKSSDKVLTVLTFHSIRISRVYSDNSTTRACEWMFRPMLISHSTICVGFQLIRRQILENFERICLGLFCLSPLGLEAYTFVVLGSGANWNYLSRESFAVV